MREIKEYIEEFAKYFAWVLGSGLHGVHLIKPTEDFIENALKRRDSENKEYYLKMIEEIIKKNTDEYHTSKYGVLVNRNNEQIVSDLQSAIKNNK